MRPSAAAFLRKVLFATIVFWACFSGTFASTIRDDKTWSDYESLAADYSSTVGLIYEYTEEGAAIGSGTVISSTNAGTWIITAAHVVQDATSITFTLNDTTYTADSWQFHTYITDDILAYTDTADLGLIYISDYIEDAVSASLYTGTTDDLLGSTANYAGYGCTGTGLTGYSSTSYGSLHAVQNTLDTTPADQWGSLYSESVLLCDFDEPSSTTTTTASASLVDFSIPSIEIDDALITTNDFTATNDTVASSWPLPPPPPQPSSYEFGDSEPLELEGLIAPGDSGGGVFAVVDETTYLVGVNSFISSADDSVNADYGDAAGCVSVCDYLDWILETTGLSLTSIPGDANGDGIVDGSDVNILASNWQYGVDMENPDATWDMGDFNGDGIVDASDVTILAGNWQYDVADSASATAVPEPGTWAILFSLVVFGLFYKKFLIHKKKQGTNDE